MYLNSKHEGPYIVDSLMVGMTNKTNISTRMKSLEMSTHFLFTATSLVNKKCVDIGLSVKL